MKRPQAEHQLDWTRQFPNDSDTCKITLNIIAFVCCEQQINFRHLDLIPIRVAKTAGEMLKRGRVGERERGREWEQVGAQTMNRQRAIDAIGQGPIYQHVNVQRVGAAGSRSWSWSCSWQSLNREV